MLWLLTTESPEQCTLERDTLFANERANQLIPCEPYYWVNDTDQYKVTYGCQVQSEVSWKFTNLGSDSTLMFKEIPTSLRRVSLSGRNNYFRLLQAV